jgi:predicted nucleic acid-binding protein
VTGYLLDTNVISEPSKLSPSASVLQLIAETEERQLFLSVLTFGEISRGIALLPASKKRDRYERFLDMLGQRFDERILAFDRAAAEQWGALLARCSVSGTPMPTIDSMLAATALTHNLTMVTRNVSDFRHAGVPLIDPFA